MGNKKPLEKRSFTFDVRAAENEKGKYIDGRPIVYESKSDFGLFDEVIDRGALDGADLTDVRFLVNHDTSKIPLARSRRNNGNSTMQLNPDYEGMTISAQLDVDNNAEARALYSATQRGDITGMSFMFSIDDYEWEGLESDRPVRHIKKIGTVVEVSAVTFPAYEATDITARSQEALESARAALESARAERAKSVDTDDKALELAKAKFNFKSKL
jgi:HK97 family phage prohead protease